MTEEAKQLYADWFLVVRQLETLQNEYKARLDELNAATKAALDPLNAQVQAFIEREKALKDGIPEEYAE